MAVGSSVGAIAESLASPLRLDDGVTTLQQLGLLQAADRQSTARSAAASGASCSGSRTCGSSVRTPRAAWRSDK